MIRAYPLVYKGRNFKVTSISSTVNIDHESSYYFASPLRLCLECCTSRPYIVQLSEHGKKSNFCEKIVRNDKFILLKRVLTERHGYPFEEHKVQTSDGYILGVHRIPYSPKNGRGGSFRGVIFLQHGLLCSSSDWVLAGPGRGLAFLLSDLGFDVWMGNARGNTYSKAHTSKSVFLQPFWNFSWHEIGLFDLSSMIDYVLWNTGVDQIEYVGHSQGTTTYLLLNSMVPEFSSRIIKAHLLAPVAYMYNMESPLAKVAGPLLGQPNALVGLFGSMEFMPNNKAMELMGSLMCKDTSKIKELCTNTLFLIGGFHEDNVDIDLLPEIMATTPAGCSVNQITHYLQEYNSGYYRQWDYGILNKKHYKGQKSPPEYYLANVRGQVQLYYSSNDYMASVKDVQRLMDELHPDTLVGAFHVADRKFTHIDFLWGLNVKEEVYDILIENLAL